MQDRCVHVDARQRVVGVDRRVSVAGEVFGAGGDARRLEAGDVGGRVPGHQVRVGAEGADADDGVAGVGVHVRGGRPVEIDAAFREPAAEFEGHLPGQRDVVHGAQRVIAREGGSRPHLQARDVAALLVDRHQDVVAFRAQLGGQPAQLRGRGDVPAEQSDRGEAFAQAAQQPVRSAGPGEAGLEDGEGVARQGVGTTGECRHRGRYPFTAPAVRPAAILR
ncbi:hypothetical protein SAV31267_064690 [Streptomyces avermitilis]|uniref:Uncharacterized protein n=1 Tax=Streptomyces avermitilis TaxID=33903 RepID=A0A4D4MYZ5_STRAX|nr:hypothetical protein SAV31267_064690 [Streptomyces avermitilis]